MPSLRDLVNSVASGVHVTSAVSFSSSFVTPSKPLDLPHGRLHYPITNIQELTPASKHGPNKKKEKMSASRKRSSLEFSSEQPSKKGKHSVGPTKSDFPNELIDRITDTVKERVHAVIAEVLDRHVAEAIKSICDAFRGMTAGDREDSPRSD